MTQNWQIRRNFKGEVSIGGDSAIEEAVQAASEVDDWDKVLSQCQ